MLIKDLNVQGFRNIEKADFIFSDGVNIFCGENAQGKTNLMECIAACLGRSFRKAAVKEMESCENSEANPLFVSMSFVSDLYPEKINLLKTGIKKNRLSSTINGLPYSSAKQLYSRLKYVIFVPEDLYLIKGSPEKRREYLDSLANDMNVVHFSMVNNYGRALKQKNNLLYSFKDRGRNEKGLMQLEIWNQHLAKLGINVMSGRLKYFFSLCQIASEYYKELSGDREKLSMIYHSSVFNQVFDDGLEKWEPDKLLSIYMDRLAQERDREISACHSLVGVHRDDVSFLLDGKDAKSYGSQGQIRSIAVSLRLAEARMFMEKYGERPVVILDDILSELDEGRRSFVINHIENYQVFITGCNIDDFFQIPEKAADKKIWEVKLGNFEEKCS